MTLDSWWRAGVIYQIYPRSFQDSGGDGVGDLAGILRRLPDLERLGVDALWLSPIFPSPMADFGYDICDYTNVDPVFGTLADLDVLVEAAHRRGIRIILDLVPNHTSDRHPWFVESRTSRTNAKRDWYVWRDPAPDGGPPNNWLSEFGGSAWQLDPETDQYYYHAFLPAQPDLNWRSHAMRAAVYDVMRFWLRRGIDGFRVDVVWHLIKDDAFRDNPPNPDYRPGEPAHHALRPLYTTDRPEIHDVIAEMRQVAEEFTGRVLIGEIYLPVERLVAYYGRDLRGLHLPFNFSLLDVPWDAHSIARTIARYESLLPPGGWPNWVLGNHDRPRVASRVGAQQARIAAMLLLTLRGTPTLYYGDEIGMQQVDIPPDRIRDPMAKTLPGCGRDGCRTPMQWDASDNAGFSSAEPWLPLAPDFGRRNVERQCREETSIYRLVRRLIGLRRESLALRTGSYRPVVVRGDAFAYAREQPDESLLVALNLGSKPIDLELPAEIKGGTIVLSSIDDRQNAHVDGTIALRGDEGLILRLVS